MEEYPDELGRQVQTLSQAVSDLQQRVAALERSATVEPSPAAIEPVVEMPLAPAAAAVIGESVGVDNLAPLLGWAFLGLSGAYLLRALTESGTIPGLLGAAVGIAYAAWWLYLASRRAWERPLFSTVHGLTAALILSPMLFEVTARFRLMNIYVASVVLVSFTVWALAVGWRRNLHGIAWIGTLAGLFTASALFRETHDAAAWVFTILAIAAAVEFAACRDHWLGLRWVVACAADLTILTLTYVVNGQETNVLFVLACQIALVGIYLSSTVDRTIIRGLSISWFEIIQAVCAFLVGIGGALHIVALRGANPMLVGAVCAAGGIACYLLSFAFLERHQHSERNFYTYSTFAISLVAIACWLSASGTVLASAWSLLAVALMCVGTIAARITLRIHATIYLVLAVVASGFVPAGFEHLIHRSTWAPAGLPMSLLPPTAGAILCYAAMVWLSRHRKPHWTDPVEAILSASIAAWGIAAAAAAALSLAIAESAPLRTALLVALAIGMAACGRRWKRSELTWLVYPILAFAGLKLLAEDLHHGRSITLFVSLIVFGGALVLLPRWLRRADEAPAPASDRIDNASHGAAA